MLKFKKKKEEMAKGKGTVTTTKGEGDDEVIDTKEEDLGGKIIEGDACIVTVKAGKTVNLGNYESIRFDVGVSIPCEKADLDEAFNEGYEWVGEKMQGMLDDLES